MAVADRSLWHKSPTQACAILRTVLLSGDSDALLAEPGSRALPARRRRHRLARRALPMNWDKVLGAIAWIGSPLLVLGLLIWWLI